MESGKVEMKWYVLQAFSGFENKAVKKVFYKPLHLEINYQTLHIIYLFAPQQLYFPVALHLQHISRVFQR